MKNVWEIGSCDDEKEEKNRVSIMKNEKSSKRVGWPLYFVCFFSSFVCLCGKKVCNFPIYWNGKSDCSFNDYKLTTRITL